VIIIADHGNADYAVNPDGSPNTAHSLNPVPIYLSATGIKASGTVSWQMLRDGSDDDGHCGATGNDWKIMCREDNASD
jgi:hypothetical protein